MSQTTAIETKRRSNMTLTMFYAATVLVAAAMFMAVRAHGESAFAVSGAARHAVNQKPADPHVFFHVLLAMATVIVVGRGLGSVLWHVGQPRVIGEILAGILLGPSLLGLVWSEAYEYLLPAAAAPHLQVLAQFGVILYMFLVGLELNLGELRHRGHATLAISHASILLPFMLGACLALPLFPRMAPDGVAFTTFALFLGVSMSVTAFPVLARILTDRGLSRSPVGVVALACAAIDDITAWCLLAVVVGVARADVESALRTVLLAAGYVAVMLVVVRPLAARWVARRAELGGTTHTAVATVFVALLASSLATEIIGIHAIFGAFLLGAIIPHDSRLARDFLQKLEDIVAVLLLPAFFAFTGMRTEIQLVSGWENVAWCAAIVALATLGKFAGSAAAARVAGLEWREASAIGILMNTRGLMELIVLNIGLDLGVISPTLFAMLVIMAVVTTMATSPVLAWCRVDREPAVIDG